MVFSTFDRQMMLRAVQLAKQGLNTTTPNPRVGCVLVKDQQIVGEGYHVRAGEAHAEVIALSAAGAKANGATAYVTLEPCSHYGQTGPCAEALVHAGVNQVIFGMEDPNPNVSGRGLRILKGAGVEIRGPLLEETVLALNPGFIKRMKYNMPFVRVKSAMSLDGRTAMASGESKWITGPKAREDVQQLRARSCAIVTGVESVIHDNPALTVRLDDQARQPLRVILDTHGRCPKNAEILSQPGDTLIACGKSPVSDDSENLRFWSLPERDGRIDLHALLSGLAERGCNEILVETGATLAGRFIGLGLVDELVIYIAPKLMGSDARPLFQLPIATMSGELPLRISDIRAVGEDWRITAVPDPES